MKKVFIALICSLMILSCTKNDNNSNPSTEIKEVPDASTEISSLMFEELDLQVSNPLDFGTLNTQSAESRVISIRNTSASDISFTIQPLIGAFSISVDRCNGLVKANKSCLIGVVFRSSGLYNGNYSNSLILEKGSNQVSIPLTAQISGKPHPVSGGGLPDLQLSLSSAFDSLTPPTRSLIIKNVGDGIARNIQALLPVEFKVLVNRCGSGDLYPGKTCSFGILFKDYKTSPAPGAVDFVVRSESNNSVASLKKIDSRSMVASSVSMIYTGTYTDFPANPKTEICSGTVSFTKTILSCKDQYNHSVDNALCPAPDSITYQSPAGELAAPVSITGGNSFYSCNLGESSQYLSRVSCNIPSYFPVGLSCSAQSFTGTYASVSNPVPNACDGTQTVQKPLVSGSCVGSVSLIAHEDSNCPSTAPQTFQSPAGNKVTSLTGGSVTGSCVLGSSSQTYSSFTCNAGRYFAPISLSGQCQLCNAGTVSGANATSCSSCNAGQYAGIGSTSCSTCSAGTYSTAASGSCTSCSPGSYSGAGAGSCSSCGSGKYQSSAGASSCNNCTNQPADMTAVTAINYGASSGLTSNSCPISSVSCSGGWTNPVWSSQQCMQIELVYGRGGLNLVSVGDNQNLWGYSYLFTFQSDGNAVLYSIDSNRNMSGVIWSAGTGGRSCSGSNPCRLLYQGDGNLVAYQDGFGAYWQSGANPAGSFVIKATGVEFR